MFKKVWDGLATTIILLIIPAISPVCKAPSDGAGPDRITKAREHEERMAPIDEPTTEKSLRAKVLVPDTDGETSIWVSPAEGMCSIKGSVLDDKGNPEKGAKIHISNRHHGYDLWISLDDEGRFEIKNLKKGTYELQLVLSKENIPESRVMSWNVAPGENRLFFFPEKNSARLFGKILDPDGNPVPGCILSANLPSFHEDQSHEGWMLTGTDEEGRYDMSRIPPGDYELTIRKPGEIPDLPGGRVTLGENEMRSFLVKILPGIARGKIKILGGVLPESLNFKIRAKRKETPRGPGWSSSEIAPDGTFEIRGLPAGEYVTRVIAEDYLVAHEVAFTIPEGRTSVEFEIPMIPAGTALFRILDGKGKPRKETVRFATVRSGKPSKGINVDAEKLAEGEYRIRTLKPDTHRFIIDVQGIGMLRKDLQVDSGEESVFEIRIDPPPIDYDITVETRAISSEDPFVYYPMRPLLEKDLRVAVAGRDMGRGLRWLEMGKDFGYNEKKAILWLLKEIPVDLEKEYILIKGTPYPKNIFFFNESLEPGTVEMTLNGRDLIEGHDFIVNYRLGKVTVLDPEIEGHDARFSLRSGKTEISERPHL